MIKRKKKGFVYLTAFSFSPHCSQVTAALTHFSQTTVGREQDWHPETESQWPFEPVRMGVGCDVANLPQRGDVIDEPCPISMQLFALQAEIHRLKKEEPQPEEEKALVQHKLPPYVSNMDRLGDSEL